MAVVLTALLLLLYGAASNTQRNAVDTQDPVRIDLEQLVRDLSILSHDSMEGRRTGTPGADRARRYLVEAFSDRGIAAVEGRRLQRFPLRGSGVEEGVNVFGRIEGRQFPDRHLVVSAHYDHLGVAAGSVYNGADDNASGTAALLAIGGALAAAPTRHSVLLVAFDAEESGLVGAREFLADPPVPLESILLNVNMDMVSRSERGELYAAGTFHYPFLTPLVDEVAGRAELRLLRGHDQPNLPGSDDWTSASDHGPFHEAGIPFVYFGVEDHPGYHQPSDTFENVTIGFYGNAVETILDFIRVADREAQAFR